MRTRIGLLFLTIFFGATLAAQTHTRQYDVIADGEKIGHAVAVKKLTEKTENINITCEMVVKMIFSVDVSYSLNSTFQNGVLISSQAEVRINGRVQNKVDVLRTGNTYVILKDGDSELYTDLITWSSASLYFYFPDATTRIFSEADGTFKTLERKTLSTFELTDPEKSGLQNTYTYAANRGLKNVLIDKRFVPDFELAFSSESFN